MCLHSNQISELPKGLEQFKLGEQRVEERAQIESIPEKTVENVPEKAVEENKEKPVSALLEKRALRIADDIIYAFESNDWLWEYPWDKMPSEKVNSRVKELLVEYGLTVELDNVKLD